MLSVVKADCDRVHDGLVASNWHALAMTDPFHRQALTGFARALSRTRFQLLTRRSVTGADAHRIETVEGGVQRLLPAESLIFATGLNVGPPGQHERVERRSGFFSPDGIKDEKADGFPSKFPWVRTPGSRSLCQWTSRANFLRCSAIEQLHGQSRPWPIEYQQSNSGNRPWPGTPAKPFGISTRKTPADPRSEPRPARRPPSIIGTPSAPTGRPNSSPGQRPGFRKKSRRALKGRPHSNGQIKSPFQGLFQGSAGEIVRPVGAAANFTLHFRLKKIA